MYVLILSFILGYGQLLVLDESLTVLLAVSWYCCNSLYVLLSEINDHDNDDK